MDKAGVSRAAIEETQQLIRKLRADFREEKKRGVVLPGHNMVKAAIERHPAMVRQNQTDSCLPCQKGTQEIHSLAGGTMAWVHLHHDQH